jgi:hypothetical protein
MTTEATVDRDPAFDPYEAIDKLQALGVVVHGKGFHFPEGCSGEAMDAIQALGTAARVRRVLAAAARAEWDSAVADLTETDQVVAAIPTREFATTPASPRAREASERRRAAFATLFRVRAVDPAGVALKIALAAYTIDVSDDLRDPAVIERLRGSEDVEDYGARLMLSCYDDALTLATEGQGQWAS